MFYIELQDAPDLIEGYDYLKVPGVAYLAADCQVTTSKSERLIFDSRGEAAVQHLPYGYVSTIKELS